MRSGTPELAAAFCVPWDSMTQHTEWRNRITGYADVDPTQLVPHPMNFRRHPKAQQDALSGAIDELGVIDEITVQAGTDMVIDGHLRVELAMRQNQQTVRVKYVDLTDDEANLALATMDPISAMAFHDAANLKDLLDSVSTGDAALMAMLSELAEDAGVIPSDVTAPDEFGAYGDDLTTDYCCPKCGYEWSGKPK